MTVTYGSFQVEGSGTMMLSGPSGYTEAESVGPVLDAKKDLFWCHGTGQS